MPDNQLKKYDVAVIGGGIVGLAMAYTAAQKGQSVVLFERHPEAIGASIRNFGLIWPVGQAPDKLDRALRARAVWQELQQKAGFWAAQTGSLHLAYHADEMAVIAEFAETASQHGYTVEVLSPDATLRHSAWVRPAGLQGALYSKTEINVDPRQAITAIHRYLRETMGVVIQYNSVIAAVDYPRLHAGAHTWEAERIFVCTGADFETLYPEIFAASGITKCKLQMLRTPPQSAGWSLGPSLCAGLTLQHYDAFAQCASLQPLKRRFEQEMPEYLAWGIHVLVSQTATGEITLGDSHEYGLHLSPFDQKHLNDRILEYLHTFTQLPDYQIAETWHGIYPKLKGATEFIAHPSPGVTIVNGLSGAGMTMSFGLAQEIVEGKL